MKRLDALWRDAVRRRDGEICRFCRRNRATAVHHVFSRRHYSTRWDLDNGVLLCFYCHIRIAHEDPEVFRDWFVARVGQAKFDALKARALSVVHRTDFALVELSLTSRAWSKP